MVMPKIGTAVRSPAASWPAAGKMAARAPAIAATARAARAQILGFMRGLLCEADSVVPDCAGRSLDPRTGDDGTNAGTMVLTELGYRVLEAPEAEAALAILRSEQRVDLLFTDVVLPGKTGRVLADAALELRPGLKVLFT